MKKIFQEKVFLAFEVIIHPLHWCTTFPLSAHCVLVYYNLVDFKSKVVHTKGDHDQHQKSSRMALSLQHQQKWRMPSFQLSVSYLDSVHMCAVVFVELVSRRLWIHYVGFKCRPKMEQFGRDTRQRPITKWPQPCTSNCRVQCLVFVELSLV